MSTRFEVLAKMLGIMRRKACEPHPGPAIEPPMIEADCPESVIVDRPTLNYIAGRDGHAIDMIVLHSTEGSYQGAVDWLRNYDRPNRTSAHYVIAKDGRVSRLVEERDIAWHAGGGIWDGRRSVNQRSVGIELENRDDGVDPFTEIQLNRAMGLCARICDKHGVDVDDVVGHADVDPGRKDDPLGFPWGRFRKALTEHLRKRQEKHA